MNLAEILIPPSLDAKQALRLRRFGLAALSYALAAALLATGWMVGAFPASAMRGVAVAFVALNLGTYVAIRSGFNLRFHDPSLTRFQILAAITVLMYIVYHLDNDRHIIVSVCFLVFLFGVFRLNAREYTLITLYTLAAYALVINLLMHLRPQAIHDVPGEWMSWLIVAGFLQCFAIIGGQMNAVRRRLRDSEARFRSLTEMSSDFFWESDAEHRLTSRGSADTKLSAVSVFQRSAQIGERRWDIPYLSPGEADWQAHRVELDAHRPFRGFELSRLGVDGGERHISISGDPVFDAAGAFIGYRGVGTDITERKRTEGDLRRRTDDVELQNQILQQISQDIALPKVLDELAKRVDARHPGMLTSILLLDADGKHLRHGAAPSLPDFYNQAIDGLEIGDGVGSCGTAAYRGERVVVEDVEQHPYWAPFRDLARRACVRSCWSQPIKDSKNLVLGTFAIYHEKPTLPSDAEIHLIENYASLAAIAIGSSRSEQALRGAAEQFRALVEQSIAGIYIIQDRQLAYVNQRFAEIFGYASADEMIGMDPMVIVAEKDRGLVQATIRQRLEGGLNTLSYGFTARRKDGSFIEVGLNSSGASYRGRPAIIGLMQDITDKKQTEERIQRYVAQLETAFRSTVEVATTLSELRDPYTAGHERRVGELAAVIGAQMGFDADRQEGLRVAGHLHDVGKMTIPAEILSKPGKLGAIEFQLIQAHAQASYDVLKTVEWSWPVAEVALQHHERMDGSGYPQGLKGDAILIEARILAVADVVEAMSSHRPYRPGLGIEAALAEIERGRGTSYDPVVSNACLKLFRENGYTIPA